VRYKRKEIMQDTDDRAFIVTGYVREMSLRYDGGRTFTFERVSGSDVDSIRKKLMGHTPSRKKRPREQKDEVTDPQDEEDGKNRNAPNPADSILQLVDDDKIPIFSELALITIEIKYSRVTRFVSASRPVAPLTRAKVISLIRKHSTALITGDMSFAEITRSIPALILRESDFACAHARVRDILGVVFHNHFIEENRLQLARYYDASVATGVSMEDVKALLELRNTPWMLAFATAVAPSLPWDMRVAKLLRRVGDVSIPRLEIMLDDMWPESAKNDDFDVEISAFQYIQETSKERFARIYNSASNTPGSGGWKLRVMSSARVYACMMEDIRNTRSVHAPLSRVCRRVTAENAKVAELYLRENGIAMVHGRIDAPMFALRWALECAKNTCAALAGLVESLGPTRDLSSVDRGFRVFLGAFPGTESVRIITTVGTDHYARLQCAITGSDHGLTVVVVPTMDRRDMLAQELGESAEVVVAEELYRRIHAASRSDVSLFCHTKMVFFEAAQQFVPHTLQHLLSALAFGTKDVHFDDLEGVTMFTDPHAHPAPSHTSEVDVFRCIMAMSKIAVHHIAWDGLSLWRAPQELDAPQDVYPLSKELLTRIRDESFATRRIQVPGFMGDTDHLSVMYCQQLGAFMEMVCKEYAPKDWILCCGGSDDVSDAVKIIGTSIQTHLGRQSDDDQAPAGNPLRDIYPLSLTEVRPHGKFVLLECGGEVQVAKNIHRTPHDRDGGGMEHVRGENCVSLLGPPRMLGVLRQSHHPSHATCCGTEDAIKCSPTPHSIINATCTRVRDARTARARLVMLVITAGTTRRDIYTALSIASQDCVLFYPFHSKRIVEAFNRKDMSCCWGNESCEVFGVR
jgi:hypothetical protein